MGSADFNTFGLFCDCFLDFAPYTAAKIPPVIGPIKTAKGTGGIDASQLSEPEKIITSSMNPTCEPIIIPKQIFIIWKTS
tara:strand:- start:894 stop:1133 length:240 start_codon:yes stop_codon:yes gene_type:complete